MKFTQILLPNICPPNYKCKGDKKKKLRIFTYFIYTR